MTYRPFNQDFGDKVPVLIWEIDDGDGTRVWAFRDQAADVFADDIDGVLANAYDPGDASDGLEDITVRLTLMPVTEYEAIQEQG